MCNYVKVLFLGLHVSAYVEGPFQRCILARQFTAPGEALADAARCIRIARGAVKPNIQIARRLKML
jgi:hypothetical protein